MGKEDLEKAGHLLGGLVLSLEKFRVQVRNARLKVGDSTSSAEEVEYRILKILDEVDQMVSDAILNMYQRGERLVGGNPVKY